MRPTGPPPPPNTVACLCQPGFTGPNCGMLKASCEENPCLNGGLCQTDTSSETGYRCDCRTTGHRGQHCELEVESCGTDACHNGGQCFQQPGGFLCQCSNGYTGLRCGRSLVKLFGISLLKELCRAFYNSSLRKEKEKI